MIKHIWIESLDEMGDAIKQAFREDGNIKKFIIEIGKPQVLHKITFDVEKKNQNDNDEVDISKYSKKLDLASKELDKISADPKVLEEGEELHRRVSRLWP